MKATWNVCASSPRKIQFQPASDSPEWAKSQKAIEVIIGNWTDMFLYNATEKIAQKQLAKAANLNTLTIDQNWTQ